MRHFIWVPTFCKSTRLGVSGPQKKFMYAWSASCTMRESRKFCQRWSNSIIGHSGGPMMIRHWMLSWLLCDFPGDPYKYCQGTLCTFVSFQWGEVRTHLDPRMCTVPLVGLWFWLFLSYSLVLVAGIASPKFSYYNSNVGLFINIFSQKIFFKIGTCSIIDPIVVLCTSVKHIWPSGIRTDHGWTRGEGFQISFLERDIILTDTLFALSSAFAILEIQVSAPLS